MNSYIYETEETVYTEQYIVSYRKHTVWQSP